MTDPGTMVRFSKFRMGDLALQSAFELQRAEAGRPFEVSPLVELADALGLTALPATQAGDVSNMRPGYYEPLERLYRSSAPQAPEDPAELTRKVQTSVSQLRQVAHDHRTSDNVGELVDFCLRLNREFVRRRPPETRFGRPQRGFPSEAFVG